MAPSKKKPPVKKKPAKKAKPTKKKTGRPEKIDDPAIVAAFLTAVKMCAPYVTACEYAGIAESTFYLWMDKAKEQTSGKYFEFSESVKKAAAVGELKLLREIHEEKAWTAKAWLLERTRPGKYGRDRKPEETVNTIEMEFEYEIIDAEAKAKELDAELENDND